MINTSNDTQIEGVVKNTSIQKIYLDTNDSNEISDFFEYEGKIYEKDDVLILVWEDEWCRDEGINDKMDWSDFQSEDFSSLLNDVEEYYDSEIQSNGGSIEIEIKGKPIFHISNDSDNVWEEIK